jgi:hypothetical protein
LSEDLFGHPILLHSLVVTQPTYPLPLYPFYYGQILSPTAIKSAKGPTILLDFNNIWSFATKFRISSQ